jgi:aldose 1-epimerase
MLTLRDERTELVLDPEAGGLIRSCRVRHNGRFRDLLYAPDEPRWIGGFAWFGCWPLVPFANRAFGAVVIGPDGPIALPVNDAATGSAIHGFSASSLWRIADYAPAWARIVHDRVSGDDPYRYTAVQDVKLEAGGGFRVELSVTNQALRPLPYGIGLHPWFPCDGETRFCAQASRAMRFHPGYRASGYGPVDAQTDWREPRLVAGAERVANFLDWNGTARIDYPADGHSIVIEASETMRKALLWSPGDQNFLCFEPQSHALGAPSEAIAQEAAALALLAQGETLSGMMRIVMRPTSELASQ